MSMTIREQLEIRETTYLSPYATLSSKSKGRERPEEEWNVLRKSVISARSFKETGTGSYTVNPSGD